MVPNDTIHVRLLLFAVLRDIVGSDHRDLTLSRGARALDVWNELRSAHSQLAPFAAPPFTAVNESYVSAETELAEGDELAFIPPVSGG